MKAATGFFAVYAAVALAAGVVRAEPATQQAVATTQQAEASSPLKGKLVKIDLTLNEIIVKTGGEHAHEATLSVGSRTLVIVQGQNAALEDLKVGQKVTVTADNGTAAKIEAQKAQQEKKDKVAAKPQAKDQPQAKVKEKAKRKDKAKAQPKARPKPKKTQKKDAGNGQ